MAPETMNGDLSRLSEPLRIFTVVVAWLIILLGLLGNLLTIWVLHKYPRVRNISTAFIISLCTVDFIFCLVALPFDSLRFIDSSWTKVRFLCVLVPLLGYGHFRISLHLITMITINRFILITHRSIYNKVYKKYWTALMIFFCVLLTYGPLLYLLTGDRAKIAFKDKRGTCSIMVNKTGRTSQAVFLVTGFVIPFIVIVFCYARIFWVIHSSETRMWKHMTPMITSPQSPQRVAEQIMQTRSDWKVTTIVLVISVTYVLCYLPITIVKVVDPEVKYPGLYVLGHLLLYFASCVNPIVYVVMNEKYRQAYAEVLSCSRTRAISTPGGSSASGQETSGYGNHQLTVTKF